MPSRQRGSVIRRGKTWAVGYYDDEGARRFQGGFETRSEALHWLEHRLDEVRALRRGDRVRPSERPTVSEIVDRFLDLHDVDPATTRPLRAQLKHASRTFGERRPDELSRLDLEAWRKGLSPGVRHYAFRSFRQVLTWALVHELAECNPSQGIRNPKRSRHERRPILPFESWEQVEAVVDESTPATRRSRSWRSEPVYGQRNGSDCTGPTSTGRLASYTSAVALRRAC